MSESKFPAPVYKAEPHQIWLRIGEQTFQTEVAVDGNWLQAKSVEWLSNAKGIPIVRIELYALDFDVEVKPKTYFRKESKAS